MITKPVLTGNETDRIMGVARDAALRIGVAVTICIVDDAGHLMRLDRLDGASLVSLRVAEGKARTAVEMKMSTSAIEQAVAEMPSMVAITGFYPFRGAIPLFSGEHCVGAIGVSGALPDQDEQVAQSGIKAFAQLVKYRLASCPGDR